MDYQLDACFGGGLPMFDKIGYKMVGICKQIKVKLMVVSLKLPCKVC